MQFKGLIGVRRAGKIAASTAKLGTLIFALLSFSGGPVLADLTITQLANEGVLITDGESRVLIDAMVVEPFSVYGGLPVDVAPLFHRRDGVFSNIDLVLVSHRHHDHNQPDYACEFMLGSKETLLVTSSQVIGIMREKCRKFMVSSPRVRQVDPQYGVPATVVSKGTKVSIFLLSHGYNYADVQNYGHLVEMGGYKILHIGDAAVEAADFARAGLDQIDIDVALIPFWYFQPGRGGEVVNQFLQASYQVAVHIPPDEMAEVAPFLEENFPSVIILKNTLDSLRLNEAGERLP